MQRTRTLVLAGSAILAGLALVYFATGGKDEGAISATPSAAATAVAPPPPEPTPTPELPHEPGVAPSSEISEQEKPVETDAAAPIDGIHSEDPFVVREAIEAALLRKDVSALPAIQKVDLTKDGYVAAAAIDAVGKLAALSPVPERREAVRTLDGWLKQESKRKAPDALGNVSILVDALADTKSEEAAAPLIAALDSASHPLHIETRIVEALDNLGARSAAPSVARFADRVSKLQPGDEFERALAAEALAAANAALTKWGAGQ